MVGLRVFLGVSRGVSRLRWGGGGGSGGLALAHLLEVRLRGFSRAEDEVVFHLIELGVVWVSYPNNPALAGVDTGDGAHLYPAPVWDVGGGPHEGIVASPPFPPSSPPPLLFRGGDGLCLWGGAFFFWGGVLAGGGRRGRGGVFGLEPLPLLPGGGFATLAFLGWVGWGGGAWAWRGGEKEEELPAIGAGPVPAVSWVRVPTPRVSIARIGMQLPGWWFRACPGRRVSAATAILETYGPGKPEYLGDKPDPRLDPKPSGRIEAPAHHGAS